MDTANIYIFTLKYEKTIASGVHIAVFMQRLLFNFTVGTGVGTSVANDFQRRL